ncbi:MAG TPA: class I SAM-dependent methyltransferase [Anaerolineales bacterium]|nr:class I SAM-dependent methyltransferase [Anaerolineales bacterium]
MDPVLYHTHHSLRSDDLSFWRELARASGGPVLELGCGTGRVLLRLVKDGLQVHGIDNDPDMLTFLNRMIPPTMGWQIEVNEADMRSFELGRQFPLIILPCNTLSTFAGGDRKRIYTQALRHLEPGGKFAFSIPNPLILKDLPDEGAVELEDEFSHPATGNPVAVYSSWIKSPDRITFYWRYDHRYPDGRVKTSELDTTHMLDAPQRYLAELHDCGFKATAAYGDFFKTNFTPDAAYFIITSINASGA